MVINNAILFFFSLSVPSHFLSCVIFSLCQSIYMCALFLHFIAIQFIQYFIEVLLPKFPHSSPESMKFNAHKIIKEGLISTKLLSIQCSKLTSHTLPFWKKAYFDIKIGQIFQIYSDDNYACYNFIYSHVVIKSKCIISVQIKAYNLITKIRQEMKKRKHRIDEGN